MRLTGPPPVLSEVVPRDCVHTPSSPAASNQRFYVVCRFTPACWTHRPLDRRAPENHLVPQKQPQYTRMEVAAPAPKALCLLCRRRR